MKTLTIVTLFAALLLSCTASKRISYLTIPDEHGSYSDPVDLDSLLTEYAGHDGIYLSVERIIEHAGVKGQTVAQLFFGSMATDWTFCDIEKIRYVVLNPEATMLTQSAWYEKPNSLYMIVTNPDGTVRRYGLADLRKDESGGYEVHRFIYPDVQRGTIIEVGREYAYSVTQRTPPMDYVIPLQYSIPCLSLNFTFACPDWWLIATKKTGPYSQATLDLRSDPDSRKAIRSYSGENIPAIVAEPYSPCFREVYKHVQFRVTRLSMGGRDIDRTLSWQDLAKSAHHNVIKPVRKNLDDIKRLADRMAQGSTSKLESFRRIVDYVRDSIEITEKSDKANYGKAIEKKKGGILDVTGLTLAMLTELDITANLLLVHSAEDGYFDENYLDYRQIPILAVRAVIDSIPYVAFPFIKELPLDYVPQMFQGQAALLIDKDGVGTFWEVPRSSPDENTTALDYKLTLQSDGTVQVNVVGTAIGLQAYIIGESLSHLTEEELHRKVKEWMVCSQGEVDSLSYDIKNLDDAQEPLVIELEYQISNLLTLTPEEILFHTEDLFSPAIGWAVPLQQTQRQNPICIRCDEKHSRNIEITFPDEWHLNNNLVDVAEKNTFGSISGQYATQTGRFSLVQRLNLNHATEPKEKCPKLLALLGKSSPLAVPDLVFSRADHHK